MKQKYKKDITANIYELAKKEKKHKKKVFIKRSKQKQNISKERIEKAKQANKQKSRTSV